MATTWPLRKTEATKTPGPGKYLAHEVGTMGRILEESSWRLGGEEIVHPIFFGVLLLVAGVHGHWFVNSEDFFKFRIGGKQQCDHWYLRWHTTCYRNFKKELVSENDFWITSPSHLEVDLMLSCESIPAPPHATSSWGSWVFVARDHGSFLVPSRFW